MKILSTQLPSDCAEQAKHGLLREVYRNPIASLPSPKTLPDPSSSPYSIIFVGVPRVDATKVEWPRTDFSRNPVENKECETSAPVG